MTDTQQKPAQQQIKARLLTFVCQGRINSRKRHDSHYYTHVTTPAPDEYSMPSQFEIKSKQPFGEPGETFTVHCTLSGFTRERSYNDRNTGELKKVLDKTVILNLVE
jgi:hypothetical protein